MRLSGIVELRASRPYIRVVPADFPMTSTVRCQRSQLWNKFNGDKVSQSGRENADGPAYDLSLAYT